MSQSADIEITIRGSSAQTMQAKAAGLNALAASLVRVNAAVASASGGGLGGATQNITRFANATAGARAQTDAFGTTIGGAGNALDNFGTLFTRMIRIMGAYFVITSVISLTKDFVMALASAPAKLELWNTQLRALIGNATTAGEKMALLKTVAIETPLELPDLVKGLVVLQAFRVEVSEHTLPLIADLAAVSGRTFEDVAEVIGKVIAGSAPAITRSLPTLGIDPNEFKKLAAELGSRSEAIFQIIGEKFGGFAKESSKTVIGVLSNIKDAFFVILADIGSGLLPLERQIFGGVFDSLQTLRGNQPALDAMRVSVRLVVDDFVKGVKAAIAFAQSIGKVTEAFGGLKSILEVIAGMWLGRLIAGIVMAIAETNPWVIALTSVAGIMMVLNNRIGEHAGENQRAVVAQTMFAESLQRTNDLYRQNVNLVDAAIAKQQAMTLTGMVGSADQLLSHIGIGDVSGVDAFLNQMDRLSTSMGGPEHGGTVVAEMRQLMDMMNNPGLRANQPQFLEGLATGMVRLMQALSGAAGRFGNIAKEAKAAADVMSASFVPATGEIIDTLKKVGDHDITDILKNMREQFFEDRFQQPADMIKARFDMGMMSKSQALESIKTMRAQLVTEAKSLLESQSPIDTAIGFKLIAKIENLDSFTNQLNKQVKDPVSDALESALRQAIQNGADVLASALSEIFVPTGMGIENAMKKAFAGIVNLLGDTLIHLGIAKLGFDALIRNIVNLVPGGGLAAIAAGVALKVFAGSVLNSMSGSMSGAGGKGGGSSYSGGGGSTSFAPFAPSASAQRGDVYNINAVDAASLKQMADANPAAFAAAVQYVAQRDRDTGGSAFGVFKTAR